MINFFKDLMTYLKYQQEINGYYGFSLKGKYGEQVNENYNWRERLDWWWRADTAEYINDGND